MRSLLVTFVTLGTLPVVFVSPQIGILVFSWISYMNPHRLTWGFAYDFPFAFAIGAATALAFAVSKERKQFPVNAVTVLLVMFLIWISLTTVLAQHPTEAYVSWKKAFKILAFNGLLTLLIMQTRERLHALVWIIVICLGFFGVKGGLFTIISGGSNRVWGPAGSFIEDNNTLALALLTTVPLVRYLHLHTQNRWIRLGLLGCMPLYLVSAIGSYSRGAMLAMTAMLLVLFWKSKQRVLIGIVAAVAILGTLAFMPEGWFDRMATLENYQEDGSAMGRIEAWGYAIDVAVKSPIWGGGFGYNSTFTSGAHAASGLVAHSIYFQTLGAHGFVGLLLFLLLGTAAMRSGTWVVKHTRDRPDLTWARDLASMTRIGLIGFAVGGAFLNLAFFDLFYHMLAIIALTRFIVSKELAKTPAEANAQAEGQTQAQAAGQTPPPAALPSHSR